MSDGMSEAHRYGRELQEAYHEGTLAGEKSPPIERHENPYRGQEDFWKEWDRGWLYKAGTERASASYPQENQYWTSFLPSSDPVKILFQAVMVSQFGNRGVVVYETGNTKEKRVSLLNDFLINYAPSLE